MILHVNVYANHSMISPNLNYFMLTIIFINTRTFLFNIVSFSMRTLYFFQKIILLNLIFKKVI